MRVPYTSNIINMKKQTITLQPICTKTLQIPTLFFVRILVLFLILLIVGGSLELKAQRLSRDLDLDLSVNQVGYMPHAGKTCIANGKIKQKFEVINIETQQVVFTGVLQPKSCDFVLQNQ